MGELDRAWPSFLAQWRSRLGGHSDRVIAEAYMRRHAQSLDGAQPLLRDETRLDVAIRVDGVGIDATVHPDLIEDMVAQWQTSIDERDESDADKRVRTETFVSEIVGLGRALAEPDTFGDAALCATLWLAAASPAHVERLQKPGAAVRVEVLYDDEARTRNVVISIR